MITTLPSLRGKKQRDQIKKEEKEREGWPPPFLRVFLLGDREMVMSILTTLPEGAGETATSILLYICEQEVGGMAGSIPTILSLRERGDGRFHTSYAS